jgi:hypothetical protein
VDRTAHARATSVRECRSLHASGAGALVRAGREVGLRAPVRCALRIPQAGPHVSADGRDHRHAGTRSTGRESSAGVARCTGCPDRVTCVPGSHKIRAVMEYQSGWSCVVPRAARRPALGPDTLASREHIPVREGWKNCPTPGDPCPRVPPFRRPPGRATRREATGARLGQLPPTDLPRPAYPAAVDAAARAALPPTAPPLNLRPRLRSFADRVFRVAELGIRDGDASL